MLIKWRKTILQQINIIITPNINKPMYNYKIVNKIGKMENNNINNSIITTIMNENGIKVSFNI